MVARPILIVDDDIDHAVILRTVLAGVAPGASTETCTDPSRLPEVLLEAPPDAVVFIDRMLSGIASFAHVRRARDERPDLHLVLLSSALSDDDRERARAAGATDALEKPATLAGWRVLLDQVLGAASRAAQERDSRAG